MLLCVGKLHCNPKFLLQIYWIIDLEEQSLMMWNWCIVYARSCLLEKPLFLSIYSAKTIKASSLQFCGKLGNVLDFTNAYVKLPNPWLELFRHLRVWSDNFRHLGSLMGCWDVNLASKKPENWHSCISSWMVKNIFMFSSALLKQWST